MVAAKKKINKKNKVKGPEVEKLAARIRQLRKDKGYTNYEAFAFDNDLARAQYGRYEKGEDLRFSSLIKVIRAFKISPKEFFADGFEDLFQYEDE